MTRIIAITFILLLSCNLKYGTKFLVHNESGRTIDSLLISTIDGKSIAKIDNISPNQSTPAFLDMRNIDKVDGHFKFTLHSDTIVIIEEFGYYTNGMREERLVDITYHSDSIAIDYRGRYY